jgi:hypothetical protein
VLAIHYIDDDVGVGLIGHVGQHLDAAAAAGTVVDTALPTMDAGMGSPLPNIAALSQNSWSEICPPSRTRVPVQETSPEVPSRVNVVHWPAVVPSFVPPA